LGNFAAVAVLEEVVEDLGVAHAHAKSVFGALVLGATVLFVHVRHVDV